MKDATGNNVGNAIIASGTSVTWSDITSGTYSIYGGTEGRGGRTVTESAATVVLVPAPTACTLVANKANYCTADPVTGVNLTFNVTAGDGITFSVVNEDNVALQGAQPSANGYVYANVAAGTYYGVATVSDCEYHVTGMITINAVILRPFRFSPVRKVFAKVLKAFKSLSAIQMQNLNIHYIKAAKLFPVQQRPEQQLLPGQTTSKVHIT